MSTNESSAVNHSEMMMNEGSGNRRIQAQAETGFKPVFIAIGQGGFNLASTINASFGERGRIIAINSSDQDLNATNLPEDFKYKIGGERANGAGKNRDVSKRYYKEYSAKVKGTESQIDFLSMFTAMSEEVLFGSEQKLIFVCFTSAGGTGSGIGPMFTAALTNYINSKQSFIVGEKEYQIDDRTNSIPRPIVIGVTALAGKDEGVMSLMNSIECANEIQTAINKKLASFIIVDNTIPAGVTCNTTVEKYDYINASFGNAMLKFFGLNLNSSIKCVDLQDKINSLRIPGVHTFISLEDGVHHNTHQCVVPHNQTVPRVVAMLTTENETEEQLLANKLNTYGIATDDSIIGFFDPDTTVLGVDKVPIELFKTSIFGLFGITNIGKIVEGLRDKLHLVKQTNDAKQTSVDSSSKGFDSLSQDKQMLSDKFTSNTNVMSNESINDLF